MGRWLSFEEAREWSRASGIKSRMKWQKARKKGLVPDDIPSTPHKTYQDKWVDWYDWFGTSPHVWLSFEEAREWARASGIKSRRKWQRASKKGLIPDNIPKNPYHAYREKWVDYYDWLGRCPPPEFRSFEEAREWVRASGIKTEPEWQRACKKGLVPDDIPKLPSASYRDKWVDWKDWLGTSWRSFEDAREWVRASGIKNWTEWCKARKKGLVPDDIPKTPRETYRDKWVDAYDWFGTGPHVWRSFEDAREWVRASGIKNWTEWLNASKSGLIPDDIPKKPHRTYRDKWVDWNDWFGTKTSISFKLKKMVHGLYDIWTKKTWPYETSGKIEVCEMIQENLDLLGYDELSFLSLPGNGREIKQLIDNGFDFKYNDCLGVERQKAKALQMFFRRLFTNGEIGGIIPVVNDDIDKVLLDGRPLPEFNAIHMDYNGPLTDSHVRATEMALQANPDAVVAVTVQAYDRFGWAVDYEKGKFPFITMNPELLFFQPYKGIRGCPMETYCFLNDV